jgi:hypothetical protein
MIQKNSIRTMKMKIFLSFKNQKIIHMLYNKERVKIALHHQIVKNAKKKIKNVDVNKNNKIAVTVK